MADVILLGAAVVIPAICALVLAVGLKQALSRRWVEPVVGVSYIAGHLGVAALLRLESQMPDGEFPAWDWAHWKSAILSSTRSLLLEPTVAHDWLPAAVAVGIVMTLLLPLSEVHRSSVWQQTVWLALMMSFTWRMTGADFQLDVESFPLGLLLRVSALGVAIWLPGQSCIASATDDQSLHRHSLLSLNVVAASVAISLMLSGDRTGALYALVIASSLAVTSVLEWGSQESGSAVPRIVPLLVVGSILIGLETSALTPMQCFMLYTSVVLATVTLRCADLWGNRGWNRVSSTVAAMVALAVVVMICLAPNLENTLTTRLNSKLHPPMSSIGK